MVTTRPQTDIREKTLTLIDRHFPERLGYIRRIHPIWESYFRINFHDIYEGNIVHESHFVHVHDEGLTELN